MNIIDIGMYDASDSLYYLDSGNKVVAVEANPALCAMADRKLSRYVQSGQLAIVNAAVSNVPGNIELHVCGQDLGSSSVYGERIANRFPLGTYRVPTVTMQELISKYGRAEFIKIDIEGADRECVLSLTPDIVPTYLSFEVHEDPQELLAHAQTLGYRQFKLISQTTFRALQNQHCLRDRAARKLIGLLGFGEPRLVKRGGRLFVLEHSAGPAPWESDGPWHTMTEILDAWAFAKRNSLTSGWYDVHAKLPQS